MERIQTILAKETWNEEDISILLETVNLLPREAKERLGLAPVTPKVEVKEPVKPVVQAPTVETAPKAKPRRISKK